jgi:hypothetical protein
LGTSEKLADTPLSQVEILPGETCFAQILLEEPDLAFQRPLCHPLLFTINAIGGELY